MVLRIQQVALIKKAFELNLVMCGVENGQIQWLGNYRDLETFKQIYDI